jgi:hypothetical protein
MPEIDTFEKLLAANRQKLTDSNCRDCPVFIDHPDLAFHQEPDHHRLICQLINVYQASRTGQIRWVNFPLQPCLKDPSLAASNFTAKSSECTRCTKAKTEARSKPSQNFTFQKQDHGDTGVCTLINSAGEPVYHGQCQNHVPWSIDRDFD